jgi:hypothetical protein
VLSDFGLEPGMLGLGLPLGKSVDRCIGLI